MRRKDDPFPEKTVVEHQHSSIEVLELVIPEDMKDPRLRSYDVFRQARIVGQDTNEFAVQGGVLPLITAQIQKGYEWFAVQLGCVQLIAADEINADPLTYQSGGHAECVRPVVPAGE